MFLLKISDFLAVPLLAIVISGINIFIVSHFWFFVMGYLSCFFVEAKVFDLLVEEGLSMLRIVDRSRGVS
jgi:ABC-type long-subunit fatty acid transport system fused permease/ATPase subunit